MKRITNWLLCTIVTLTSLTPSNIRDARAAVAKMRTQKLRTMAEFAEQEIILPNGPYKGRRFKFHHQPKSKLWFDAVDSGHFNRFVYLAPVQSGKTLDACVIPCMYYLFELCETVIFGVPTMDTAGDKYREDLLPVIQASRYAKYLPTKGAGARGGTKFEAVTFTNGCTLKFMSGHGGDEKRSAFTSRVVVITEADKFDCSTESSEETDPITQLERRTNAFGSDARIFIECTVSHPRGRIWQEYEGGRSYYDDVPAEAVFSSEGRINLPCPHCRAWVCPEREHVIGYEPCGNIVDARENTRLFCPECGEAWTEEQRKAANQDGVLVHRGQSIDKRGRIKGDLPRTYTLGFRYNCVNNHFVEIADIGGAEWQAKQRGGDDENDSGEKDMLQFWWAKPFEAASPDLTPLDVRTLAKRRDGFRKGIIPDDTERLSLGVDLGMRVGWWLLLAARENKQLHVVDYGSFDIWNENMQGDPDIRLASALRGELVDLVTLGWPHVSGETWEPHQVMIDSNYKPNLVMPFCRERNGGLDGRFMPTLGRGTSEQRKMAYTAPRRKNKEIRKIGDNWHIIKEKEQRTFRVVVNADHWKSWIHARLLTPPSKAGALTFYEGSAGDKEHISLIKHLTAEKQIEVFEPERGKVVKWVTVSRSNHWLDCAALAACGLSYSGWRLTSPTSPTSGFVPPPPDRGGSWWSAAKAG